MSLHICNGMGYNQYDHTHFSGIIQIEGMEDLIAELGESHTEDNITSHLKAPCLIHGQSTFTNCNYSTGEIPFFSLITNLYPTIKLSMKLSFD